MGTRGFIGFVADGEEKLAYNHWDSYPGGLGLEMLGFAREAAQKPAVLREAVKRLRVVAGDSVSTGSLDDWYCLLRGTQGNPAAMLEAGVIEDASSFPLDSLFCEWGYLIDTDGDGMLEVYKGFQCAPHDQGRFAGRTSYLEQRRKEHPDRWHGNIYYPVALVARFALADLPSDEDFLTALKEEEG